MDPTRSESGDTVSSDGHMSKRGPGTLRWALMMAADCARKRDPYFGDYYSAKKGTGKKHHYVALSGVARKLLGGDERGAALRADAPEEPPARPSQGCLTSLFAKTESSAIASDPMRNRPSVRALYLVFAFQVSY